MLLHGMSESCYIECTGASKPSDVSGRTYYTYRSIPLWHRCVAGRIEPDSLGLMSVEFCVAPLTVEPIPPFGDFQERWHRTGWGDEL